MQCFSRWKFCCDLIEIHFFSAINFQKDRVVDGDLNVVKDLVMSNYCEVSQNKDNTKIISSNKDFGENFVKRKSDIVITCVKEGTNAVAADEEKSRNPICTNHIPEKCGLHDMKMEQEGPTHVIPQSTSKHDGSIRRPNPNHLDHLRDSSKNTKFNNLIEDHSYTSKVNNTLEIFDKQMRSAILVGKLVSANGLCHNDIMSCLRNFVCYMHYLMCKLDTIYGIKNKSKTPQKNHYRVELQKQFLLDVDEAWQRVKSCKIKAEQEKQDLKCILQECSFLLIPKTQTKFQSDVTYYYTWSIHKNLEKRRKKIPVFS